MGMFDYLRVDVPLTKGGEVDPSDDWQTKDGPCDLGLVVISAEGRLLFEESHYESVPEEERPNWGTEKWNKPLGKLIGSMRRVITRVVDSNFHGDLRFYRSGNGDGWEEYTARFTDGQLVRITKVKVKKEVR